jgi:hypothetical protein
VVGVVAAVLLRPTRLRSTIDLEEQDKVVNDPIVG